MTLEIISPTGVLFQGEVARVTLPERWARLPSCKTMPHSCRLLLPVKSSMKAKGR